MLLYLVVLTPLAKHESETEQFCFKLNMFSSSFRKRKKERLLTSNIFLGKINLKSMITTKKTVTSSCKVFKVTLLEERFFISLKYWVAALATLVVCVLGNKV